MTEPAITSKKRSQFSALRINNFRLLLTGNVLFNAAGWIQTITISWLVYDLTNSGVLLGVTNLIRSAAAIAFTPLAGILIDRMSRRKLITVDNTCMFIITLLLGLLILFGHAQISYIFIFSAIAGIVYTVDNTLRQVLVFDVVPRSITPNAISLNWSSWALMRLIGPSIGGFLILWFGAGFNFIIQAVVYVLIAVTILQIKFPLTEPNKKLENPFFKDVFEGFRYVLKDRILSVFLILTIIEAIFVIPIFTILPPIYAVKVFGDESGRVLGFLMAAVGAGGILGGITISILHGLDHRGRLQLFCLFMTNISILGFAFSQALVLAIVCLVSAGFFEMIFVVSNQTSIQLSLPDNLRSRVTAISSLSVALSPFGGLLAGFGSDLFGGPKTITIIFAVIAAILSTIIFLSSSPLRNYRISRDLARK